MDTELAKDIAKQLGPTSITLMVVAGFYIFKNIWEMFFKNKDRTDENTQAVRELNINLMHMRDRLLIMESRLDKYDKTELIVNELHKDYQHLFEKHRDHKEQLKEIMNEIRGR